MPTFGYLVFMLRVNTPGRPRQLDRLSAAGDEDVDLLDQYEEHLRALGFGYHRDTKVSEGYRIKRVDRRGRTLAIRINKGPEGGSGEVYHREQETSVETGEAQSLLSGLRACVVVPKDCYYGLLFLERIGVRHLRTVLEEIVIRPAGREAGVVTRMDAFAEASDWRTALEPQQTLRVTELLAARSSGDDASTIDDRTVRIEVAKGVVRRMSDRVKGLVVDRQEQSERSLDVQVRHAELLRRRRAGADAFTVEDAAALDQSTAEMDTLNRERTVDNEPFSPGLAALVK